MDFDIIPKQEADISYSRSTLAVKSIDCVFSLNHFDEAEIDDSLIAYIMNQIKEGTEDFCLFAGDDEESDRMEVVSDGVLLSLTCCFNLEEYYCCCNEEYADTISLLNEPDFSDKAVFTDLESCNQEPIPRIEAITDMELGLKAVEYFMYTGKLYPGLDWIKDPCF